MLLSGHFRAAYLCVLFFLYLLEHSVSNETGTFGNSSQEQIETTPQIGNFNRSALQMLLQEANNMFVSNISLTALLKDKNTQQRVVGYRERNRQVRLMTLQSEVLQRFRFDKKPNVTSMPEEQRQIRVRSYHRRFTEPNDRNETGIPCDDDDPC